MYPSIDLVLFWNSIACVVCNGLHGEKDSIPMNMYPSLNGEKTKRAINVNIKKIISNERSSERTNERKCELR